MKDTGFQTLTADSTRYFLLRSTKSCFVKYNWIKISTKLSFHLNISVLSESWGTAGPWTFHLTCSWFHSNFTVEAQCTQNSSSSLPNLFSLFHFLRKCHRLCQTRNLESSLTLISPSFPAIPLNPVHFTS